MDGSSFPDLAAARIAQGPTTLTGKLFRYLDVIEQLRATGVSRTEIRELLAQSGIVTTANSYKCALHRARVRRRRLKAEQMPAEPRPLVPPVKPLPFVAGGLRTAGDAIPPGPAQLDAAVRRRPTLAELEHMGRSPP